MPDKRRTMVVRAGGNTIVDPELVSVMGDRYHIVITENDMGELVIQSVSGRFWFQALNTNTIVVMVEPYPVRPQPEKSEEG